jgi:vacuolar-type H+-ATPase subunit I/STV1
LNVAITQDKKDKDDFLSYVNTELTQVNGKIKNLEAIIDKINAELNGLRDASKNNTTIVAKNDSEKALLEQQLQQLKTNEAQLKQQLEDLQKGTNVNTVLQQQLDEKEAQIVQLTEENKKALENKDASNQAALDAQTAENNKQIQILQDEIAAKDAQLTNLQAEQANGASSIQAELDKCKQQALEYQKSISELTSENNNLTEENNSYKETITNATTTINTVVASLNELLKQIPSAQDRSAIAALFQEINAEIEKLNNILTGVSATNAETSAQSQASVANLPTQPTQPTQSQLDSKTVIQFPGGNLTLGQIKQMLKDRMRQTARDRTLQNKYVQASQKVGAAQNQEQVINALSESGVQVKNNAIMGGKTRKRQRKNRQHGGFTYNKQNNFFKSNKLSSTKSSKTKSSNTKGRKTRRSTRR